MVYDKHTKKRCSFILKILSLLLICLMGCFWFKEFVQEIIFCTFGPGPSGVTFHFQLGQITLKLMHAT